MRQQYQPGTATLQKNTYYENNINYKRIKIWISSNIFHLKMVKT